MIRLGQVAGEMQYVHEPLHYPFGNQATLTTGQAKTGNASFTDVNSLARAIGIGFDSINTVRGGVWWRPDSGFQLGAMSPFWLSSQGQNRAYGLQWDFANSRFELFTDNTVRETVSFTPGSVTPDEWHHIAFVLHIPGNVFRIWYDSATLFDYTSMVDPTVNAMWSGYLALGLSATNSHLDDMYCDDLEGAYDFGRPPKLQFMATVPELPGSITQWTPVGAASNLEAIDDPATPDEDSTYNKALSTGLIDTFETTDITLPPPTSLGYWKIHAVIPQGVVRKNNVAQDAGIKFLSYDGATYRKGAGHQNVSLGYGVYWYREPNQPDGTAWNEDDLNDMEFGYESMGTF